MARVIGPGKHRDKDWLHDRYAVKGMKISEMAEELGCSGDTIMYWLVKHGIELRPYVLSQETLQKRSEGLKAAHARGAFSSSETIEKQRCARRAAWGRGVYEGMHQTHEYREMMVLAHDNPETKRKVSVGVRTAHQRSDVKQRHRKAIQDSWTAERRMEQSAISSEIQGRSEVTHKKSKGVKKAWADGKYENAQFSSNGPTWIERETAETLVGLNFRFIQEWSPKGFSGRFDFYLPDFGVTIECQGGYWHDDTYFPGVVDRDREKRGWAEKNGYVPIELWEDDIREHGAKLLLLEELVGEGLI